MSISANTYIFCVMHEDIASDGSGTCNPQIRDLVPSPIDHTSFIWPKSALWLVMLLPHRIVREGFKKTSQELSKTTRLFYKSCYFWSVPVWSGTPKTHFRIEKLCINQCFFSTFDWSKWWKLGIWRSFSYTFSRLFQV